MIDSHCHLTYEGLCENAGAVLRRAAEAGVERCVTIGTHREDHEPALAMAREHAEVFLALGVHPHHAAETEGAGGDFVGELERLLRSEVKVVAVGECGLDYHYDFSPREAQKRVFVGQLELAQRLGLPVVLHVREAHTDAWEILRDFPKLRMVVHCFTGTPTECRGWLDRGAYLGITGIVTYKNAGDVQAAAKMISADRLLLETDAPYLSPREVRKIKTNEPAFLMHTARFVAELRGVSLEELGRQTTENVGRFFGQRVVGQ